MNKSLHAMMLILPLSISMAYASDDVKSEYGDVKVSGFGTLGYARTNSDDTQFSRPNQVQGAGTKWKNGVDSNLGLQATTQLSDKISATGQILVRKDASEDFKGELAWAFAKYQVNDKFSVRVGRIGLPAYMISDYRNVGYANTMIRPQGEVYSQVSFNHIDGIDATYSTSVGEVLVTGQLALGRTTTEIAGFGDMQAKREVAINVSAEYGPLTVRVGRVQADVSLTESPQLNGFFSTLSKVGYADLSNSMSVVDKKGTFTSIGAVYDYKNYLVQTEYSKRKNDSFISDTSSWYVMGGYRIGKFLPYVAHSSLKQDSARSSSVIPAVGPLAPLAASVNGLLQQGEQTSNTIGVRWDFKKNAALKFQIDRISPRNGNGLLFNATPGRTGSTTVAAAAVDFVF